MTTPQINTTEEDVLARLTKELSEENAQTVSRVFRKKQYAAGALIINQSDYPDFAYIVLSGSVRVFNRDNTIFIASAGDAVGLESMFSEEYGKSASAVDQVSVLYSTRGTIMHLMETIPQFAINVSGVLCVSIKKMEDRILTFSSGQLLQRLTQALLKLASEGEQAKDGTRLVGATHEFLASVVGASREAVTIAMKKLRSDGAVRQAERGILAVNVEILRKLVKHKK